MFRDIQLRHQHDQVMIKCVPVLSTWCAYVKTIIISLTIYPTLYTNDKKKRKTIRNKTQTDKISQMYTLVHMFQKYFE